MSGRAHIIGAGLSGLSAAVELARNGISITLYEGASNAGGRCRSFFDSELNRVIDNGNHLVFSGNYAIFDYLELIGATDKINIPIPAEILFMDLADRTSWSIRPDKGSLPWSWLFPQHRVPGTGVIDYLKCWRLMQASDDQVISDVLPTVGVLWDKFWEPVILAVTNTNPKIAAAGPMKRVILETLAKGERACRSVFFPEGLTACLVTPAVNYIKQRGGVVFFNQTVRHIQTSSNRITALEFGRERIEINKTDTVIFALPAATIARLVGGIDVPDAYSPIVNAHFRLPGFIDGPPLLGLVNSAAEWLFLKKDVVSVTVSAAETLVRLSSKELSEMFWRDIQSAYGLKNMVVPPNRIVREKRATILQTPNQLRRRPPCRTHICNLFLAGDWTETGLPATIEGSVRSGLTAATEACVYMS